MQNLDRSRADARLLLNEAHHLFQEGKIGPAAKRYRRVLKTFPRHKALLNRLVQVEFQLGRLEQSIEFAERSLREDPAQPLALADIGRALLAMDRMNDALAILSRAVEIDPSCARAYDLRGICLKQLGRFDEALESYSFALKADPQFFRAYRSRGNLHQDLHNFDEALADFDRAIALKPGYAEAYASKSELLLLMGDYEQGWRLHEYRWMTTFRKGEVIPAVQSHPLWLGEQPIAGKTVLLHGEVGFGDFMMFVRYARLLRHSGANVVICAPLPLVELFRGIDAEIKVVPEGDSTPPVDVHCPIMSLPLAFKTLLDSIPSEVPYLSVGRHKQELWAAKLGAHQRLRVGLMWAGKGDRQIDLNPLRKRSISLKMLEPITCMDVEFHSLQKEVSDEDAATLAQSGQIVSHQADLRDFSDTAALIQQMDLVISIDTSVAHLAGALGKPLWVLLPFSSDYRWAIAGDKSPWYPTATLFRLHEVGDWKSVVERVRFALANFVPRATVPHA